MLLVTLLAQLALEIARANNNVQNKRAMYNKYLLFGAYRSNDKHATKAMNKMLYTSKPGWPQCCSLGIAGAGTRVGLTACTVSSCAALALDVLWRQACFCMVRLSLDLLIEGVIKRASNI